MATETTTDRRPVGRPRKWEGSNSAKTIRLGDDVWQDLYEAYPWDKTEEGHVKPLTWADRVHRSVEAVARAKEVLSAWEALPSDKERSAAWRATMRELRSILVPEVDKA